jgi:hypothetical protein
LFLFLVEYQLHWGWVVQSDYDLSYSPRVLRIAGDKRAALSYCILFPAVRSSSQ